MYIMRKFNLIGGKIDFQYISSVKFTANGILIGYDSKKEYAKNLTADEQRRVEAYLKAGDLMFDGFRGAIAAAQDQQLAFEVRLDAGDHPSAQLGQQGAAFAEHGHRVVVAAEDHQLGTGLAQLDDEVVIASAICDQFDE